MLRLATAAAAVASLLSVPAAATIVKPFVDGPWTFWTLPTGLSGPCDMDTGFDGTIWVEDLLIDKLVNLDPATGNINEYNIPYTLNPSPIGVLPSLDNRTALACVMRRGNDGLLYFASGVRNQIGSLNETTKNIKVFTPQPYNPAGNLFFFNDFWPGTKGMFFTMTTGNQVAVFDYVTHKVSSVSTTFPITGGPLGLVEGPDGRIWGTEIFAQRLFAVNQTTLVLEEFDIPLTQLVGLAAPAVMRVTTDNRYIWFCAFGGGGLGRFDIYSHEFTAYPAPVPLSFPTENDIDGDGQIWFSSIDYGSFFRFNPATGTYVEYSIPEKLLPGGFTPDLSLPIAIHYNQADNSMYFTLAGVNNQIGKLALDQI